LWGYNDKDNYTITAIRKELLDSFDRNWKPFKQYCSENLNVFARKSDTYLKLFVNYSSYEMTYQLYSNEGKNLYGTEDKFEIDYNEPTKDKKFIFGLNLQYFTDVLDFFDEQQITIKFSSKVNPFVIEEGNKYALILPARLGAD
jgi:hypothetical protein